MPAGHIEERSRQMSICSAMCLPGEISLSAREIVTAYAHVFKACGDPIAKVRVNFERSPTENCSIDQFIDSADVAKRDWTYIWLIPSSHGRRKLAEWMSIGVVFNQSQHMRTLFLGLPAAASYPAWEMHRLFWKYCAANVAGTYGFGFDCLYGHGPDYFAMGIDFSDLPERKTPEATELIRAWSLERQGDHANADKYRHERGMILSVFPMNFLTAKHLSKTIGGETLKAWILKHFGDNSIERIGTENILWRVPDTKLRSAAEELSRAGICIAGI
jgi:hypothetical protein